MLGRLNVKYMYALQRYIALNCHVKKVQKRGISYCLLLQHLRILLKAIRRVSRNSDRGESGLVVVVVLSREKMVVIFIRNSKRTSNYPLNT